MGNSETAHQWIKVHKWSQKYAPAGSLQGTTEDCGSWKGSKSSCLCLYTTAVCLFVARRAKVFLVSYVGRLCTYTKTVLKPPKELEQIDGLKVKPHTNSIQEAALLSHKTRPGLKTLLVINSNYVFCFKLVHKSPSSFWKWTPTDEIVNVGAAAEWVVGKILFTAKNAILRNKSTL